MHQKDLTLILILLLLLSGVYLLRPEASKNSGKADSASVRGSPAKNSETLQKIEKSIDQHMKLGRRSEELRRDLTAIENKINAPPIDPSKIDPIVFNPNEPIALKLNAESAAIKAYKESVERKRGREALTPEQRIINKLNRDEWERNYREEYEKEYIRAYIENARKAGYDVKLNSKGEIIEVVDIGTDQPIRFPQSVDDSGKKATPSGSQ
jgi:hypothetical protein